MRSAVDRELATALARDDAAEDRGMHGDDRETCWQCQDWADHAHNPITNARITLDQYAALVRERQHRLVDWRER